MRKQKDKQEIISPFISVTEAARLLGVCVPTLRATRTMNGQTVCKRFPQLRRIQDTQPVGGGGRGSAILFVRAQVEALSLERQKAPELALVSNGSRGLGIRLSEEDRQFFAATGAVGLRIIRQLEGR